MTRWIGLGRSEVDQAWIRSILSRKFISIVLFLRRIGATAADATTAEKFPSPYPDVQGSPIEGILDLMYVLGWRYDNVNQLVVATYRGGRCSAANKK